MYYTFVYPPGTAREHSPTKEDRQCRGSHPGRARTCDAVAVVYIQGPYHWRLPKMFGVAHQAGHHAVRPPVLLAVPVFAKHRQLPQMRRAGRPGESGGCHPWRGRRRPRRRKRPATTAAGQDVGADWVHVGKYNKCLNIKNVPEY